MREPLPETLGVAERFLVRLEEPPWAAVYRIAIGYVMFPLFNRWSGADAPDWRVILLFAGVLLALRLIPAIVRKTVRFSPAVIEIWAEKRQLAKEFDSYQWQKLFWFGIGMAGYIATSGSSAALTGILTAFSLLAGGIGLFRWQGAVNRDRTKQSERLT
jgi:hypothetical protein